MTRALLLVAAVLAAGCFGTDAPEAPPAENLTTAEAAPTPQRPDGRDGGFAAFNETNRTETGSGGLDHRHDLWKGRERVTLYEGDVGFQSCCYTSTPMSVARVVLPEGAVVYEGTGTVEITLSNPERRGCTLLWDAKGRICTDRAAPRAPDAAASVVHLLVRDASVKEYADLGEVAWGTPVVIPIQDPKQTDMPHATRTLWGVQLRSPDARDDTLHVHVKIEILRAPGTEIPLWPGHPDLYADSPTRTILQASGAKTRENGPMLILDPAASERPLVAPDKIVGHGTRTLHVFVNITDVKVDNPALQPTEWVLAWHNASGIVRLVGGEAHTGDVREHRWTLAVDEGGMDTPYADASRWGFGVRGYFEVGATTPAGYVGILGCSGLCAMYEVTYDIVVIATTEALPDEAYDVRP